MINITQEGWYWGLLQNKTQTPAPDVWHDPKYRISSLLGPDGEPLRVGLDRPKMGFDLRKREE